MPDRYGDDNPNPFHDPRCRRGWLGDNSDGQPVPCLVCKPHLRRTVEVFDRAALLESNGATA